MTDTIKKTSLYDIHKKVNANIVNYNGCYLPIFYTSIQEEHNSVRNTGGIFDVSHMGNVTAKFKSKSNAVDFFNYLLPNDFSKMVPGKCIYSPMLNNNGGVVDDLIVMSLTETHYHIIVNSANIEKDFNWIKENTKQFDYEINNESDSYTIIAVQGKESINLLNDYLNLDLSDMKSFSVKEINYKGNNIIISRTGYTGEFGFELCLSNTIAPDFFERLLNKAENYKIIPCGLGARDTLRLEAGLPLYSHELDEEHSPLQTNVYWSMKLKKENDFIGKKATLEKNNAGFNEKLVGFEVLGKAIPRNSMTILDNNMNKIGYVTSGSYSPTLQKNIGLAYINIKNIDDSDLLIQIRNKVEKISIIDIPFYKA